MIVYKWNTLISDELISPVLHKTTKCKIQNTPWTLMGEE